MSPPSLPVLLLLLLLLLLAPGWTSGGAAAAEQEEPEAVFETPDADWKAYTAWMDSVNIWWHEGFAVARFGPVRGYAATRELRPGQTLIAVPMPLVLNARSGLPPAFLDWMLQRERALQSDSRQHAFLAAVLAVMYQTALGTHSKWFHYIKSMPKSYDELDLWSADELLELQQPELLLWVSRHQHELQQKIARSRVYWVELQRIALAEYGVTLPAFSSEDYKWAHGAVCTRSFDVMLEEMTGYSLVPVVDLFNHRHHSNIHTDVFLEYAHVPADFLNDGADEYDGADEERRQKWLAIQAQNKSGLFTMLVAADSDFIDPMEQLFFSYGGDGSNKHSLMYYGYVQNATAEKVIRMSFPDKVDHADERRAKWLRVAKYSYVRLELPAYGENANVLNGRELHLVNTFFRVLSSPLHALRESLRPSDMRVEVGAWEMCEVMTSNYLGGYPTTWEEDTERLRTHRLPYRLMAGLQYRSARKAALRWHRERCLAAREAAKCLSVRGYMRPRRFPRMVQEILAGSK